MKRAIIIALASLFLIATLGGCAKNLGKKNSGETPKDNSSVVDVQKSQEQSNLTMDNVKKLDDNKLTEQISGGEEQTKIEDVDLINEEIEGIDAILSDKDPIADIPSNIKVDK